MARRTYDDEFKRDTVELLLSGSKELKPLALDLGVCPGTLRNWRDRYLREREPHGPPRGPAADGSADELRRLRKENETLKRQRDILKKALGILSEPSSGGMP